jgi:regulator of sirC expression with transglutaminase-like and TPR domain
MIRPSSAYRSCVTILTLVVSSVFILFAAEPELKVASVKELAARIRPSLVVVKTLDISGEVDGTGAGFVVSKDGLIATCYHVVREGRAVKVQFSDGREFDVQTMHASDRLSDLSILKIKANDLPFLPLGDSEEIEQGEKVVAMGNPLGLEFSIVEGIVSARRDDVLSDLIQVAIPIERGNSGGPLLDHFGRVHGILNAMHAAYENVGFAVPVNRLKSMLEKPNPIPMSRWVTFGGLNKREWSTVFAAQWSQRGGVIHVDSAGTSFGGRALCISKQEVPEVPYEVAVDVRLDDESGAAGLAFESDGKDIHYGFYPTGGRLRLTRFDGPSVFTWKVFETLNTEFYQLGEWNHLKVRVEKDGLKCYLNDELIIESDDTGLRGGRVGLAKFRQTKADFKNFRVAKKISPIRVPSEKVAAINRHVRNLTREPFADAPLIDALEKFGPKTRSVLFERARELEREAERVRQAAELVHFQQLRGQMLKELDQDENKIDLLHCTLLLSKLDNPELDVGSYRRLMNQMAQELRVSLPKDADDEKKIELMNQFLFDENGFHGSRNSDAAARENSYIDHVLDNREGLQITLSVVYIELARRIGLTNVHGAQIPEHFMACYLPEGKRGRLIDVFERGKMMTSRESRFLLYGNRAPATKRSILGRMVRNLAGSRQDEGDWPRINRYLELAPALEPENGMARVNRSVVRYQNKNMAGAREDLNWLLENEPPGIPLDRVRAMLREVDRAE